MTFHLTVPGTDIALVETTSAEHGPALVAAGHFFTAADHGIWDLTQPERRATLDQFARDYAAVRTAEQREMTPAEVQTLPMVDEQHPLAAMWKQRALSHARFKTAIARTPPGCAVDIGAGSGWLAADLARDGWHAAAIDVTVEGGDGLAAAKYHSADVMLARAEMEALPFASNSVDLAVFNAALHYAGSVRGALDEAQRVVRPGGVVVVLDSPVFHDPAAGHTMVAEFADHARTTLGVETATHEGPGFITIDDLDPVGFTEVRPSSGMRDRVHRWLGARRAGRETAQRPLLIATIGDQP